MLNNRMATKTHIRSAVAALQSSNLAAARQHIHAALSEKINAALAVREREIAATLTESVKAHSLARELAYEHRGVVSNVAVENNDTLAAVLRLDLKDRAHAIYIVVAHRSNLATVGLHHKQGGEEKRVSTITVAPTPRAIKQAVSELLSTPL